jgi:hypothetical protein
MKKLVLTMCLFIVVGCSTTQSEKGRLIADLKSADIYGFNDFIDPLCTCPRSKDNYLKDLTRETNALLGPGKEVQFVFRPPPLMKKDEAVDPFLESRPPCPFHSSSNTLETCMGQNFITAWDRLKLLCDICNLSIDIDPKSRTVILYGKGTKLPE